mmetsp:Transcript_111882/g.355727  ORF Transcript_111882/g.355727 Transcript_111882/m.355727 type:complete len:105 (-) Transcript_111882:80-394(-)
MTLKDGTHAKEFLNGGLQRQRRLRRQCENTCEWMRRSALKHPGWRQSARRSELLASTVVRSQLARREHLHERRTIRITTQSPRRRRTPSSVEEGKVQCRAWNAL